MQTETLPPSGRARSEREYQGPQPAETKTVVNNAAKAPKQETNGEPQRNTASATGMLSGAAPTVPSGGFGNRFGSWN